MVLRIRRRGGGSEGKVDWSSGLLYRIQGQNSPVRAHRKGREKAKREMGRERWTKTKRVREEKHGGRREVT